jgi:beta-glucosidase
MIACLRFALYSVFALPILAAPVVMAGSRPWDDSSLPALERAQMALDEMTEQEKLSLVHGGLGAPWGHEPKPDGAIGSAGYVPGIPRLGIPPLQETDAELGIANPGYIRRGDTATAMPSDLALASTWDLATARRQGEVVGAEARAKGFSVLLGGAANLIRDPRGGRNFEYFSEDPLLTGLMAGSAIAGVQSRHLISTLKHFTLNAQETDRVVLDAKVNPAAARESDLLAFEIAIEKGLPGSVMCAYNQVNGAYSCENPWLLDQVLKNVWPAPSASDFVEYAFFSLLQRIRPRALVPGQDGDTRVPILIRTSASSAISEVRVPGRRSTVRPSRFHRSQTSSAHQRIKRAVRQ